MAMLPLVRLRELSRSKWQYLAVGVVIVLGISVYNAARSLYLNLERSYAESYGRLKFEDFGIKLASAPERSAQRLHGIPGVIAVEGRLTEEATVKILGGEERLLVGRLVSIPAGRSPTVNDLRIVEGRSLKRAGEREALLEYAFAKHHGLRPGATLEVSRGRGRARLKVVGIAQSPEFLYVVRSKQDLFPAEDTFGVMFLSPETLGPIVGKANSINEVKVRVSSPDRLDSAMREAKRMLAAYGADEPVVRKDQPSEAFLRQDLEGFQMYSILFPAFFLTVAAMTIHTLLTRMVQLQRPMIGLLRALGFSQSQVAMHYVKIALTFGLIAGVVGTALGIYLARVFTLAYMSELTIPYPIVEPHVPTLALGVALSLGFCVAAAWAPARAAARTKPAEALRGALQGSGRVLRIDLLARGVPLRWRIPLRNLVRQPRRTFSTLLGVVAGVTLLMLARGLADTTAAVLNDTLAAGFKEDLRVELLQHGTASDVERVRSWPGVVWAEGELGVAADFKKGGRTYSALFLGVPDKTLLRDFVGLDQSIATAFEKGAVFGPTLRRRLDLKVGDTVEVSLPKEAVDRTPKRRLVRVAGFTDEPIGTVAYLPVRALRALFRSDLELPLGAVSSIRVKADPHFHAQIRDRLEALPGAAAVTSAADLRKTIEEMIKTFQNFVWILELFGMALAFSIVFNTITVSVLERAQESATMQTLGFSRAQIAGMVTLETLLIATFGVVLGLPVGRWFVGAILEAAQTPEQMDLFVMKATVSPSTYGWAAALTFVAALLSQIPAIRFVTTLDLARAIKERSN